MLQKEKVGFRVYYFRDLANAGTRDLRVIRLNREISELEYDHFGCAACGTNMKTLYTLVSGNGRRTMRRGLCENCGYIG